MGEITCPECGKTFPGTNMLRWHLESSHGIKPVDDSSTCHECGLPFGDHDLLVKHRYERHGVAYPQPAAFNSHGAKFYFDSFGTVIGRTFTINSVSFLKFTAISAIGGILLSLIMAEIGYFLTGNAFAFLGQSGAFVGLSSIYSEDYTALALLASFLLTILSIPLSLLQASALIFAAAEHQIGRSPGILQAYIYAFKRLRSGLYSVLLMCLYSLIPPVVVWALLFIPAVLFEMPNFVPLVLFGLVIVTIFVLFIRWSFVLQSVVLEENGAVWSLRVSRDLVSGRWWRVFSMLLLLFVILCVIEWGLIFTLGRIPFAGMALVYILVTPFWAIGTTLLYFKLRADQQGPDAVAADVEGHIGDRNDASSQTIASGNKSLASRTLISIVGCFVILCLLGGLALYSPGTFRHSMDDIVTFDVSLNANNQAYIHYFNHSEHTIGKVDYLPQLVQDSGGFAVSIKGTFYDHNQGWELQDVWLEFIVTDTLTHKTNTKTIYVSDRILPGKKQAWEIKIPLPETTGRTLKDLRSQIEVSGTIKFRRAHATQ